MQVLEKSGERGRNRTYNLLIKSQLLCQLSYAPTANDNVGTNVDYTIRSARSCARMSLSFAISLVSGRLNLDLKRGSARQRLRWRTAARCRSGTRAIRGRRTPRRLQRAFAITLRRLLGFAHLQRNSRRKPLCESA